jgi:hypothetical protein
MTLIVWVAAMDLFHYIKLTNSPASNGVYSIPRGLGRPEQSNLTFRSSLTFRSNLIRFIRRTYHVLH